MVYGCIGLLLAIWNVWHVWQYGMLAVCMAVCMLCWHVHVGISIFHVGIFHVGMMAVCMPVCMLTIVILHVGHVAILAIINICYHIIIYSVCSLHTCYSVCSLHMFSLFLTFSSSRTPNCSPRSQTGQSPNQLKRPPQTDRFRPITNGLNYSRK